MSAAADLAAFILAGGRSTRMGTDKAFVPFEGRTLLARTLDLARSVTPEVRIVGDSAKFSTFAPVVEDVFPGCGPLGGIHAGLRSSSYDLNLVIAVDMPFVSTALLHYLIERAGTSQAIVTVPHCGGRNQPLSALYRPAFADAAEHALRKGHYKIDALFASESTQVITAEQLEGKGFSADIFRNLNTPAELAQARR